MAIARHPRRSKRGDSARRSVNKVHDQRADGRSPRREYSNGAASRHVNVPPMRRGYLSAVIFHTPPESEIVDPRPRRFRGLAEQSANHDRFSPEAKQGSLEMTRRDAINPEGLVCPAQNGSRDDGGSQRRLYVVAVEMESPRAGIWPREISQLSARLSSSCSVISRGC